MSKIMTNFQNLGRTLMLPIAVLPVAGLLLRLGQPDLLSIPFVAAAGAAIFSNLGLLFAIGVAVGFARGNHGAAGLAGLVGYLVATHGAQTLVHVPAHALAGYADNAQALAAAAFREKEIGKLSVPIGIISGIISGLLYNRYSAIRLPEFLAFFGGRRFVPIAAGTAGIAVAAIFGFGWPHIESAMDLFSRAIVHAGGAGLFVYGVLNRVLIVTGLHHILNNIAWFILGDFNGTTGDLSRFFVGDKSAGAFMAGFFPVMMFGLPAACYAMYRSAPPERRREVAGMYLSLALTSFLTGVTEPIEFTFMFLAPLLYAIHAVLTGLSMTLMNALGVKLGFGFSAGLFDYLLNFNKATHPLWLIPVGLGYALVYYSVFRFFIVRFNLRIPGRDDAALAASASEPGAADDRALAFVAALGGAQNLDAVAACTTRLRLEVRDQDCIDEAALKRLGARGLIRPSATTLQVVLGPVADLVASDINAALIRPQTAPKAAPLSTPRPAVAPTQPVPDPAQASALLRALGGAANIAKIEALSSRLILKMNTPDEVDIKTLAAAGPRTAHWTPNGRLHVIIGPAAAAMAAAMQALA